MKFDEMQVIWNTQVSEPIFAYDRQSVNAFVTSEGGKIERSVEWFEWSMIAVCLLLAIILPLDAWLEGDGWHQYLVGLLCLSAGIGVYSARKRRLADEVRFDQSIMSIAERSLSRLDHHARWLKKLLLIFHLPIAVCAGIGLTIFSNTRVPLIWTGVLVVSLISWLGTVYDVRCRLNPRRRDLELLLSRLNDAERIEATVEQEIAES